MFYLVSSLDTCDRWSWKTRWSVHCVSVKLRRLSWRGLMPFLILVMPRLIRAVSLMGTWPTAKVLTDMHILLCELCVLPMQMLERCGQLHTNNDNKPRVGARVVRIGSLRFLALCHKRQLNYRVLGTCGISFFFCFWLSVPVQWIAWNDSSPKWPIMCWARC